MAGVDVFKPERLGKDNLAWFDVVVPIGVVPAVEEVCGAREGVDRSNLAVQPVGKARIGRAQERLSVGSKGVGCPYTWLELAPGDRVARVAAVVDGRKQLGKEVIGRNRRREIPFLLVVESGADADREAAALNRVSHVSGVVVRLGSWVRGPRNRCNRWVRW